MCFAPQQRALFHHLNFQKCSEHGVLCTFSLRNVLRATTACTFSTSQLPKVLRTWLQNVLPATTTCNFSSLIWPDGSAPAALASLLFDPPEPQITGKTQCLATLLSFHACIFCLLPFSLLWSSFFFCSLLWLFPPLLFHLSKNIIYIYTHIYIYLYTYIYIHIYIYIVGSLTSKLPSVTLCEVQGFCW